MRRYRDWLLCRQLEHVADRPIGLGRTEVPGHQLQGLIRGQLTLQPDQDVPDRVLLGRPGIPFRP